MSPHELLATLGIYGGAFVVAIISSIIPFVTIDVFVGAIARFSPAAGLPLVVVLATVGQLVGKLPIYYATRGAANLAGPRVDRIRRWLARWERKARRAGPRSIAEGRRAPRLVLFATILIGPFSLSATAAALLGVRARTFSLLVLVGRGVRLATIVAIVRATL